MKVWFFVVGFKNIKVENKFFPLHSKNFPKGRGLLDSEIPKSNLALECILNFLNLIGYYTDIKIGTYNNFVNSGNYIVNKLKRYGR